MSESYKSFTERVIQPAPVILGLRLLPFTLGMSMLLKAANSKFLTGISNITLKELIIELVFAILVCSTTYDEFNAEINNGDFERYVNKYITELTQEIKASNEFNIFFRVNQFCNYLKAGTTAPLYEVKESGSSDISINPIEAEEQILSTLMTDCGYTRNEVLNLPLTETLSAFLLYAYKQGTIEIVSKELFDLKQTLKGTKCRA